MLSRLRRQTVIFVCGFLFVLDRWLKYQALHGWASDRLVNRWLGWHLFFNSGVAFSIPVPGWLIVFLTMPVIALITYHLSRIMMKKGDRRYVIGDVGLLFILLGAVSNFLDRVLYSHTIDYLLIFTGVINLADVMIVAGFVVYFFVTQKTKN